MKLQDDNGEIISIYSLLTPTFSHSFSHQMLYHCCWMWKLYSSAEAWIAKEWECVILFQVIVVRKGNMVLYIMYFYICEIFVLVHMPNTLYLKWLMHIYLNWLTLRQPLQRAVIPGHKSWILKGPYSFEKLKKYIDICEYIFLKHLFLIKFIVLLHKA